MIIVNQDTTEMVNFNNIIGINIRNPLEDKNGEFAIIAESDDMEYKLGKYKTEERAKEVLQLIVENYDYITRALVVMNGGIRRMFTCYFKMPEE